MVKHIIFFSGMLSSNDFKLGVRLGEEYVYDSINFWDLWELLFVESEGGWWFCMLWLELVCVDILVLML